MLILSKEDDSVAVIFDKKKKMQLAFEFTFEIILMNKWFHKWILLDFVCNASDKMVLIWMICFFLKVRSKSFLLTNLVYVYEIICMNEMTWFFTFYDMYGNCLLISALTHILLRTFRRNFYQFFCWGGLKCSICSVSEQKLLKQRTIWQMKS